MKKIAIILACMLACFTLFSGCTDKKGNNDQDVNVGNSVEIDDADLEIDAKKSRMPRIIPTLLTCRMALPTLSKTQIMLTAL